MATRNEADLPPLRSAAERAGARDPSLLLARAQQARKLRSAMSKLLSRELFVDPAWDMMIELFIAAEKRVPLCIKDLIHLSGESSTSALRRIDRLQASELIVRRTDRADHRRVRVELTERGFNAMAAMLEHLFDAPAGASAEKPATAAPTSFRPHHPRL